MLSSLFAVLAGCCSQDPAERAKKTPTAELLAAIVAADKASPAAADLQKELETRDPKQIVDALLPALTSANLTARHVAIELLGYPILQKAKLDPDTRQRAERALLPQLLADDEDTRSLALCSLARSWKTTEREPVSEFLPTLRAQLAAKSPRARAEACHAASMCGSAVAELAPTLIERCTTDPDVGVRVMAVAAIRTVAPNAPATYQAMTSALADPSHDVRILAVGHLQDASTIDAATVQSMLGLLEADPDPDVRDRAADTLAAHTIGAEFASRALTTVLKLRDPIGKEEKLIALGRLAAQATKSEQAKAARERLERALHGSDDRLTKMATCGLARIAFAERDLELASRMAKPLNTTIGTADVDQTCDVGLVREMAATLVLIADWAELALDRAPVRAYLQSASESESWAAALLAQLDKLGK